MNSTPKARRAPIALPLGLALIFALGGCASSAPERFYALQAVPAAAANASTVTPVVLARVTVPVQLDRAEMVFQKDAGQLELSEDDRWAEPLREGIERVLTEDLANQLAGARVSTHADALGAARVVRVTVDIQRWQVWPGQRVSTLALWDARIVDAGAADTASGALREIADRTVLDVPVSGMGTRAAVAAQDAALNELAAAIASAIARLTPR